MDQAALRAQKKVRMIKNLPTLPGILTKISRMVESKQFSAEDIARLIGQDQVLTAKVLKLANSAFYGFSREITSVAQALVVLGFTVVKGLILTTSVFDAVQRRAADLWVHSLAVATASGVLAQKLGLDHPEEINLAGLLHDIGKVVLATDMTEELEAIMTRCHQGAFSLEAEAEVLGFTHPEAGRWLGEAWKLPPALTGPITHHHNPSKAGAMATQAAVVHLADIIVKGHGFGFAQDVWVPPLEPGTLDRLGMEPADLDEIVPAIHRAVTGISGLAE